MKHFLNLKLHPAVILSSVLFWFIVVVLIYAGLMYYWINKLFFSPDKNVTKNEFVTTVAGMYAAKKIYRKKLSQYKIL